MKRSFFARYALPIMIVMAFLSPIILGGARHALMTNHNDVKEWLPASYQETKDLDWFVKKFAGQLFVMISWDGCTVDDARLDTFVKKLKDYAPPGHDKLCTDVITGKHLVQRLQNEPINLPEEEAFRRLQGLLIGKDNKHTCAIITLSEDARALLNNPKQPIRPLSVIQDIAINECAVPAASIRMGGPPVDNVALDEAGQKSLMKLAAAAGIIGLAVSWWCLRSPRLVFMVFMAGLLSAAASLAIVYWVGKFLIPGVSVNAILLTMPSLVYVAAISAAIHLANFYRETVQEEGPDGAATRALAHAKLPLSLATGTTAAGLVTLAYSDLVPIQHFGIFSALGVVAATLILVFYLPSVLELFPLKSKADPQHKQPNPLDEIQPPGGSQRWENIGHWIISHPYASGLGTIALMILCGLGFSRLQTSVQLMRLFPEDAKIIADYTWLEQNLGPLVPMEIVLKMPRDTKLDPVGRMQLIELIQRRVEGIDTVGNAMSAVTFAPELGPRFKSAAAILAEAEKKYGIGNKTMIRRKTLGKRLDSNRQQFIDNDYLAEEDNFDLWRISARVAALEDVDYGLFVADLKKEVEPVLAEYNAAIGATEDKDKVTAVYTGLVPLVYKAQRSLLDGLIFGFVTDVLLVVIVLMIVVRDWSAGIILLFPAILPCVVVFGLMGWLGVVVDIGTVMTPAVALGVTIDDVVHFMLRHRHALGEGATRREAIMSAYRGCAQPMYQSWGVIGLGLSVFALSDFTPTQRFGMMMIAMLTAALVGNLVLLPALLASPLGALFGRRIVKQVERERKQAEQDAANGKPIQGFAPTDTVTDTLVETGKRVTTSPVASTVHSAHGSIERHYRS